MEAHCLVAMVLLGSKVGDWSLALEEEEVAELVRLNEPLM
jgi:hypothetical protein